MLARKTTWKPCRAAAFPPDPKLCQLSSGKGLCDAISSPRSQHAVSHRQGISRLASAPLRMRDIPCVFSEAKRPLTLKTPFSWVSPPPRDLRFRGGSGTIRDWNFRVASEFDAVIASIAPKPRAGLSAGTNGSSSGDQREGRREERRRSHRPWCAHAGATALSSLPPQSRRPARLFALALAATVSLVGFAPSSSQARDAVGLGADVSLSRLPAEARKNGPIDPFRRPVPVFAATAWCSAIYEKRLPRQPRGWYHEYTVPTPGARNRGARRIICGGNPPTEPDACFYTEDHYSSFHRIVK